MSTKSKSARTVELVGTKRAGQMLGISDSRIRQLVGNHDNHEITAVRLGQRSWMIAISEIEKYAKKNGIAVNYGPFPN